jgi:hypothetical protein
MLPDLRFVFGAALAFAMLGTAGFGMAISIRLLHDAQMASLEPPQSLAYAAPAQENPFRDIENAARFAGAAGRPEEPVAQAGLEARGAGESASSPSPEERAAASPPEHAEEGAAADKPAEGAPAPTSEAALAEPAPTRSAEPAPTGRTPPAEESKIAPPEAAAEAARTGTLPPPEPERVATAPTVAPAAESRKDADPPGQLETDLHATQNPAPATAPARRFHRKPHPRIARVRRPAWAEQSFETSTFPMSNSQWPSYNNQWSTAPATKKH